MVVFQEQVLEVSMALAGFTPGQAEALRRAMSRKRSREAMLDLWREFRDGARERGVDDEIIRTVFTKLIGFSNFGFPKAHSSAFAVLAYQSAWLRRRYPAEFLASLLNAQPMGFYPPASLVRDAQRRGVRVLPPAWPARRRSAPWRTGRCASGWDTCARCARTPPRAWWTNARPTALSAASPTWRPAPRCGASSWPSSCGRAPATSSSGRAGRCCGSSGCWRDRGRARAARSWHCRSRPAPAPALPELSRFERTITDYETTGLSTGWHLVALVRPGLPPGVITAARLRETAHGTEVLVAGLVVARQRPATAGGIVFLLLEDETGMINCIVRPQVYERYRAVVRADPLLMAWGRLERHDRTINVLVTRMERIDPPAEDARPSAGEVATMTRVRAAAPEGQHFGHGRR